MAENRNIANFYNIIRNEEHGLRYKYQFIVRLAFNQMMFMNRGQYTDNDRVIFNQLGITDPYTLNQLTSTDSKNIENNLTFFAQSTSLPQSELTTTEVTYFAQTFKFPGIVNYTNEWNVTILLDQQLSIYRQLKAWQEMMASIVRNSGGNKTIPDVRGDLQLLNNYGQQIDRRYTIEGIFPTDLPAISMKY